MPDNPVIPKYNDNTEIPFSYALRRYLAKIIDFAVCIYFIALVISYFFFEKYLKDSSYLEPSTTLVNVKSLWMSIALSLIFIPILSMIMYFFGNTLGKFMMGLHVKNIDGSTLKFRTIFYREASAIILGMGLGIPIISVLSLYISYITLKKHKVTSWDKNLGTEIVYNEMNATNWVFVILGILFFHIGVAYIVSIL